jgi:hypothetical protein
LGEAYRYSKHEKLPKSTMLLRGVEETLFERFLAYPHLGIFKIP